MIGVAWMGVVLMLAAGAEKKPLLVGHRGASAYAPEHTSASYKLAIRQGADFIEQDLQVTKDGKLICSHDAELSRTTDIAQVYPDRARVRDPFATGKPVRGWYAIDFTLAEIQRLDAGSWFNRANPHAAKKEYAGLRIPTLEDAIAIAGDKTGLYIELKHVPFYDALGQDMVPKLASILDAHAFNRSQETRARILIQSFYKVALVRMQKLSPIYARIQLLPMEDEGRQEDSAKITPILAEEIRRFAQGVGPDKNLIRGVGEVEILHAAGLKIHPYTFRGSTTAVKRAPLETIESNGKTLRQNIIEDIRRFLGYGIDGGFTDYPDLWVKARKK